MMLKPVRNESVFFVLFGFFHSRFVYTILILLYL